ncbi:MAG TPA: hypothetical protein VFV97_05730 [Rhodanobacteraceae bacterium]|nr:hypothetical protein [Rhodanobacteraceae bacterium]
MSEVARATLAASGSSWRIWRACWAAALVLTVALYFPGLRGGYDFDDFPNIVDNDALHVSTGSFAEWRNAAWASPASDLQRPLASLTFALNYYFTGLDPWPMKATNVLIHLVNGWLLLVLMRRLVRIPSADAIGNDAPRRGDWLALLVASIWLLHPINLTAVLFVVQRMESLAQIFVLLGLVFYVDARRRQIEGRPGAAWRLWIAVPACTALGIAAKESAALLPVYALLLEFTLLSGAPRQRRQLAAFYLLFLVVPAAIGLSWMLPHALAPDAYAQRPFTMADRLLTEPRVLVGYLTQILLPLPGAFSFFHDDYAFSTGLWQPWTTFPSIVLVAVLIVGGVATRTRAPLVALGILWFFAAHLLTATFFPLELVFEHRNYFASIGALLAALQLMLPRTTSNAQLAFLRHTLIALSIVLGGFTLALRAREWGNPIGLALAEVALHPASPRATYELGRTYVVLSGYQPDSPNTPRAMDALENAMHAPRASTLPEAALIMVASRTGHPIEAAWWDSMRSKLESRRPTVEDSAAIKSLTVCQREGHCVLDDAHMLAVYLAGLRNEPHDAGVLYSYAIFAFNRLRDKTLALRLAREAADVSRDPQYRINLANFLIDLGDRDAARSEVDVLRKRNVLGKLDTPIASLEARLASNEPTR